MTRSITVSKIAKSFRVRREVTVALQDVNLTVESGELLVIVGASGCGKSSLLRIMAGLETADSGTIIVDGHVVEGPSVERAMVFQDYSLFPWLTVIENVKFSRQLKANSQDILASRHGDEHERALNLLALVGLTKVRDAYPSHLSGGMRQRVAIARALMSKPSILLMDEPFGALDAQTREVMQELLLSVVNKEGTTVVFVTHDVEEAIYLGQRVVLMAPHPGRVDTVYEVPLPKMRNALVRLDPAFIAIKRKVMERIRETAGVSVVNET